MGQQEKPKLVYKYETVNEHLFENLEKNQLYFQDPRNFNDPFDSDVNGCMEYTERQWYEKFYRGYPAHATPMNARVQLNYLINTGVLKQDPKTRIVTEDMRDYLSPLTCCFSEKRNNILMWSHYANKHKGMCLSYKTIEVPKTPNCSYTTTFRLTVDLKTVPLFEVRYRAKKPPYKNYAGVIMRNDHESLFENLLTKSTCWRYEKERRMLSIERKNIQNFKKDELEGVIFGLKTKHYDAYRVYKIIEKYYINKGIPINFYKATMNKNYYKLNISKIKESGVDDYIESLT
ncbi:hypothetical protein MSSIT_1214 [Methanosarcina siciliae T4/M]|uniref:DUF2971 domain-containing protein n=1 Tax=Methanosarcina siciliae T4/M TaxID=1434120 RepID=A0A0E3P320_9EURY|nr:DUF2971 domain-containing protein [Methanosarcina siciliae]AKB27933.1 hypothetical protein MSSIT_1214 [Methanosarcina siciliae T4/M]